MEKKRGDDKVVSYKHMAKLACIIASKKREPFHYKKMYDMITHKSQPLGEYSPNTKHVENFRTRIDLYDPRFKRLGEGYYTLNQWIEPQTLLETYDKIAKPVTLDIVSKAMVESGHRIRYMKNKHHDNPKNWARKVERGHINEFNVADFFKKKYPKYFVGPAHRYDQSNKWDIKFNFKNCNKKINIDVKSIDWYHGEQVLKIEKNRIDNNWVDIFICASSNGSTVQHGYVLCKDIDKSEKHPYYYIFTLNKLHDCRFLETYLNHLKFGFNEERILKNGHPWRGYIAKSN